MGKSKEDGIWLGNTALSLLKNTRRRARNSETSQCENWTDMGRVSTQLQNIRVPFPRLTNSWLLATEVAVWSAACTVRTARYL